MTEIVHRNSKRVRPVLRWAGSKSKFVHEIVDRLPVLEHGRTYFEPFLGSASVFLAYHPKQSSLSDSCAPLSHTHQVIRDKPERLWVKLKELLERDSAEHYYDIRSNFNKSSLSLKKAAQMLYMNYTCFNGIYRVNRRGQFNVPYGYRKRVVLPSIDEFKRVSSIMQRSFISSVQYKSALQQPKKGDVVYLDPPYPPLNGSSNFAHYTARRFSQDDQIQVAYIANKLSDKGCFVCVSNASLPTIHSLYHGWNETILERTRWISCRKIKHKVDEVLYTNYS